MSNEIKPQIIEWIIDSVGKGTKISSIQSLPGATSSSVYGIEVERGNESIRLILRLFTNEGWLQEEPDLALHEAEALKQASRIDLPTPELVAYDETGKHTGIPAILMTELGGVVELNPPDMDDWLFKIAEALVSIHSLEIGEYPWSYFYWEDTTNIEVPTWSQHPELWEKAIQIALQPEPAANECFLHRDYHPTNILWQNDRLSGVVDWVNACRGPVCVDLAHCRGNLSGMYGVEAADRFLHHYQSLVPAGFKYDPYWDIANIIGVLPEPDVYPPWKEFGLKGLNMDITGLS